MDPQAVKTDKAPLPRGPYNQAVRVGDTIYVAGQIPIDPTTNQVVEGGIEVQTRRVLDNVAAILEEAGSSLDRVVKTTIFLLDVGEFAQMNAVYAEYFTGITPARSTVQVAALPGAGVRLMIDAIAVR
ncbi:MAG: RidA family protein [Chloroflexi bacterium]|nr:RidA family protein [Chloroflexota bacterium]